MQVDDDSESSETVEFLTTAGGFFAGCFALYGALTYAGVEEVLAGNLVLLALCAIGAYLLFFDGGATQAALQAQAVQQVAMEEGDIMDQASRIELERVSADKLLSNPAAAAATLASDGVLRIDGALTQSTAASLLAQINSELESAIMKAKEDLAADTKYFGDVLARRNRHDLYLDLTPEVKAALTEALCPLKAVLSDVLGRDAELFELSALISDPKSPRQPVHPDTPFREGEGTAVLTAFVALQDIDDAMGPTFFLPGSHTGDAHAAFNSRDDGGREKIALLRETPNARGLLETGDITLFDSRLLHGGGENESARRRVLFYFSFRAKGVRAPPGSLLYQLRRQHTLDQSDDWLAQPAMA